MMKIWKIVSGAASLLVGAFLVYQLTAGNGLNIAAASGTAGAILAAALAVGGVVSIAAREGKRTGSIAMAVLFGVGGVVGVVLGAGHLDLRLCAAWSLLCRVRAMVVIGVGARGDVSVNLDYDQAPARRNPYSLQEVIAEQDPQKRAAVIDALPEMAAKSYLKQVLYTFVDRREEDTEDTDGLVRALIVVLAVVGLLLVAVVAVGIFLSLSQVPETANPAPPAVSRNVQSSQVPQATPEPDEESPEPSESEPGLPSSIPIAGSGTLGDFFVEIGDAFIVDDYQGNPAVVVTYTWTNNSDETTNAMSELTEQAFQNGVELSVATVTSSEQYTTGSSLRDVRPGAQTEVRCAFRLPNTTSPIEFEVSEFLSRTGTVVYKTFDLSALDTDTEGGEAE